MTFGKWLQLQRRKRGVSQWQLAQILGYGNGQFVSNWERGLSYPPMTSLAAIAQFLHVPKDQVLKALYEAKVQDLKQEFKDIRRKRA